MLEVAIMGIGALGVVAFVKRHHIYLVRAAIQLHQGDYAMADRELRRALTGPVLPWEKNRWALCLNMRIFVKTALGELEWAEQQCEKLLGIKGLASSVSALTYDRLAALSEEDSGESRSLWETGLDEIEDLNLWETLAYFFWGLGESERAAFCFLHAPKTELWGQNLYLRLLCCIDQGLPREELIGLAKEALAASSDSLQRVAILLSLSQLHQQGGEFELAYLASQESLEACSDVGLRRTALRMSISQLRALDRYQDADKARVTWCETLSGDDLVEMVGLVHDEGDYEHCLDLLRPHFESQEPGIRYALGTTLLELGQPLEAVAHLKHALGVTFSPSPAQNLVRAYCQLLERDQVEYYLLEVPAAETTFVEGMRTKLSYRWDGEPGTTSAEPSLSAALYEGDFGALSMQMEQLLSELFSGAPRDFKLASMNYHRAWVLGHWARWAESLAALQVAEARFRGSPFQRAHCRLYSLECRAMLGEDVLSEFLDWASTARQQFSGSKAFQLAIQLVEIEIQLASGSATRVVRLVSDYLGQEPRRFQRARSLRARFKAHRALGQPGQAESDCRDIMASLPGSFLARWAASQLDGSP